MRVKHAIAMAILLACITAPQARGDAPSIEVLSRTADGRPQIGNWHHGGRPPAVIPPPNPIVSPANAGGHKVLQGVPAWTWCYGCSNTAAAIIMGYYDRRNYPNMYTGPAAGTASVGTANATPGLCPLYNEEIWPDNLPNPMDGEGPLASSHMGYDGRTTRGHVDDWWSSYGSPVDPCLASTPPWNPHTPNDCLGDFMWTSRHDKGNYDGFTNFTLNLLGQKMYDYTSGEPNTRDGMHGVKLFVQSRGYSVNQVYTQILWPAPAGFTNYTGFKFEDFMAEIDAGRPVMLLCTNHTFVGYGYDESSERVYIRTTWDNDRNDSRTVKWGEQYGGETMMIAGVIRLNAPPPAPKPDLSISTVTGGWIGEDDYGVSQTGERKVMPGGTEEFRLRLANRGNLTDTFTLTGPPQFPNWQVTYYSVADGTDITADVIGAGWTTASLPPGSSPEVRVVVQALPGLAPSALLALTLTITSASNPARADTVQAVTTRLTCDLSGDSAINERDVALFVAAWRKWVNEVTCDPRADMTASGSIGTEDAVRFIELYSAGE